MKQTCERILLFMLLASTILFENSCSSKQAIPPASPSELTIEEYPLQFAPTTDPLSFSPEQGSPEEILAKHQQERSLPFPDNSMLYNGQPAFSVQIGSENLVAFESYAKDIANPDTFQKVTVQVLKDGQMVFSTNAGDISPVNNLRGLWSFSNHWVLEVAHVILDSGSNESQLEQLGEIIQDGVSFNEYNKYEQTFGFQLIKGKPFYFFQQDKKIGISYDGEPNPLGYDQIPHYQCCSAAELNPRIAPNMVSFFAQRQGTWYYVEIGVFD